MRCKGPWATRLGCIQRATRPWSAKSSSRPVDILNKTDISPSAPSHLARALALLAMEARPAVQVVFLLRYAATAGLVLEPSISALVGATGWLLITASIYVLNGLSDLSGDRLNGSTRPLARGWLDVRTASTAILAAALCGLGCCFAVSPLVGALGALMLLLGLAYSTGPRWKDGQLAAGFTIGAGAALTYAAGWATHSSHQWSDLAFAGAVSLWVATASATKDFSDVAGDRLSGRRTLPVAFGPNAASRRVLISTAITAAGTILVSLLTGTAGLATFAIALGTCALVVAFAPARSAAPPSDRRPYRVYMVTQYSAHGLMMVPAV